MSYMNLSTFQMFISMMVESGLIEVKYHLVTLTKRGEELLAGELATEKGA
jgi:predicted transcriptional regulator